jgi:hypothetical protein
MFQSAACGAGVAALLTATPAGATEGDQRITVTPNVGLRDGQVVQVDGTGWPDPRFDLQSWGLIQCMGTTFNSAISRCGNPQAIPESEISSSGSFSVDYAVRRSFRSYDDTATVTCDDPGECSVVAFVLVDSPSRPGLLEASAPTSFAAPK